jgi:hypothetical protein
MARITPLGPPASLRPGDTSTIRWRVTNESRHTWPHDIPAGRHISVANHWLQPDGTVEVPDDGRACLPETLAPGDSCEVALTVQAPMQEGDHLLEVDLVQERVCWFAQRGSPTSRVPIQVAGAAVHRAIADDKPVRDAPRPRRSLVRRMFRPFRRGTPAFEMHVVPRRDVEEIIQASGATLLRAIDDGAAGYGWLSYTYVARKSG